MRTVVTGATGLIGRHVVASVLERGDAVTALVRSPERARRSLGDDVELVRWDALAGPAPAAALSGAHGVVNLAGDPVDQRWSGEAKRRIRDSRVEGTRNLIAGLREADPRPRVLVSGSAVGYYGALGDDPIDESAPPGDDFLAGVVVEWEREAERAAELGVRVVRVRTGVVLAPDGGALARMLTPFKLGVGGPVAGGRQYIPWIHLDDEAGLILAALDDERWSGPLNATAPEPATNRDFSKALGKALHRPALLPVPGLALRLLYGEMSQVVTTGQRAIPKRATELGYTFKHPDLAEALTDVLRPDD